MKDKQKVPKEPVPNDSPERIFVIACAGNLHAYHSEQECVAHYWESDRALVYVRNDVVEKRLAASPIPLKLQQAESRAANAERERDKALWYVWWGIGHAVSILNACLTALRKGGSAGVTFERLMLDVSRATEGAKGFDPSPNEQSVPIRTWGKGCDAGLRDEAGKDPVSCPQATKVNTDNGIARCRAFNEPLTLEFLEHEDGTWTETLQRCPSCRAIDGGFFSQGALIGTERLVRVAKGPRS